jgi:molybdopterin molybdotransferase
VTALVRSGVADYLTGVLASISPLRPLLMGILDARGGVLAEDVVTGYPLPPCDTAAIDGYALRATDLVGATQERPVKLAVLGELRAASWQPSGVAPGTCYAVAAGSALPTGADAVVPADWTDQGLANVAVYRAPNRESYVRRAGSEMAAGAPVASAGALVTPGLVGLLAAAGIDHVVMRPRPRVAVFSTGDELVEIGGSTGPGHVVDANSYALAAAAAEAGAQTLRVGIIADDAEPLRDRLEDHAMRADLLVISGGTGDGTDDTVRRLGWDGAVDFVELPLYPSTVLGYGRLGGDHTPVICLPGEPGAALIGFEVLARPVLQRLAGVEPVFRPSVKANLMAPVCSPHGLREFRPAHVAERRGGGYNVQPLPGGPQLLAGLAEANALLVLGEKVTNAPSGTTVDVLLFDRSR